MMKTRILATLAAGVAATAMIAPVASAATSTSAATATNKAITKSQVAKHKTAASCWTIVGKNVYDVTRWEAKHPGGKSSIVLMCGKNGTALFNGKHSTSKTAKAALAKYKIGHLV